MQTSPPARLWKLGVYMRPCRSRGRLCLLPKAGSCVAGRSRKIKDLRAALALFGVVQPGRLCIRGLSSAERSGAFGGLAWVDLLGWTCLLLSNNRHVPDTTLRAGSGARLVTGAQASSVSISFRTWPSNGFPDNSKMLIIRNKRRQEATKRIPRKRPGAGHHSLLIRLRLP